MFFVIFMVKYNIFKYRLALLLLTELLILWFYITPLLPGTIPTLRAKSPGFPLDDSWIYAAFARMFVAHGEIAFNPGHTSVGFTSSLWFLLLCLGRVAGLPAVGWSLFLGSIAQFILAVAMGSLVFPFLISVGEASSFDRGSREIGPGRPSHSSREMRSGRSALCALPSALCALLSVLVLLCGPLVWYSLSGMETSAFLTIGVLAILFMNRGRYGWAGLFLGLVLVTRIEGCVLWVLGFLYAVIVEFLGGRTGRDAEEVEKHSAKGIAQSAPGPGFRRSALCALHSAIPLLLIPAFFLILELLKNLYLTGTFLPTTFAGRKWLSVPAGGRGLLAYLRLWGYGFRISLLPRFLQQGLSLVLFWIGVGLLALVSLRLIIRDALGDKRKISGLFLFLIWAIGHNLVYVIMLPSPSQAGRYQAINFLLFWLVLFLPPAAGLVRKAAKPLPGAKTVAVMLSILMGGILLLDLVSTHRWQEVYRTTVRHINDVHVTVARWIGTNLPPGTRLAAFDIGALKYFSPETEIIDLGGLVDRDFADYLRQGKVVDYMKKRGADYLAMVELQSSPGWIFENLGILNDPRLRLRPLFGMMQRPEIYRVHYQIAANTFPKMVVYRIEWSDGVVE